jgi:hypothetical protein
MDPRQLVSVQCLQGHAVAITSSVNSTVVVSTQMNGDAHNRGNSARVIPDKPTDTRLMQNRFKYTTHSPNYRWREFGRCDWILLLPSPHRRGVGGEVYAATAEKLFLMTREDETSPPAPLRCGEGSKWVCGFIHQATTTISPTKP